jgi:hypothetical protein
MTSGISSPSAVCCTSGFGPVSVALLMIKGTRGGVVFSSLVRYWSDSVGLRCVVPSSVAAWYAGFTWTPEAVRSRRGILFLFALKEFWGASPLGWWFWDVLLCVSRVMYESRGEGSICRGSPEESVILSFQANVNCLFPMFNNDSCSVAKVKFAVKLCNFLFKLAMNTAIARTTTSNTMTSVSKEIPRELGRIMKFREWDCPPGALSFLLIGPFPSPDASAWHLPVCSSSFCMKRNCGGMDCNCLKESSPA